MSAGNDGRTCKAALELDGKRFRKDEVPELPLPECDAEYCRCLFLYHIKKNKNKFLAIQNFDNLDKS